MGRRRTNLQINGEHSHPPSADGDATRVLRSNMTERDPRGKGATRNIVSVEIGVWVSVIREVGDINARKRRLRDKNQGGALPGPRDARDLDIPHAYAIVAGGRHFPPS